MDFLSSFPLLFLNSGPSVYILLYGANLEGASALAVFNILKVVKAVRVTRILRLVRIIKIFGKIHNAESPMAQHHTATIATTAVFTIICTLVAFSILTTDPSAEKIAERDVYYHNTIKTIHSLHRDSGVSYKSLAGRLFSEDKNLIKVLYGDKALVTVKSDDEFVKYYAPDDYKVIKDGKFTLYVSLTDIHRETAYHHLVDFFIIIFTVLAFMLVYTRHFVQTITDIIHVMDKGFRKKNYNLLVKMRDEFEEEEIFRLAEFYNDSYLPAKSKRAVKEDAKSANISMDFLAGFQKKD